MQQLVGSIDDFHSLVREGYYLADAYKMRPDRHERYHLESNVAGSIAISRYEGTNVGVRRTWNHIRKQKSGLYVLWYPVLGSISITQDTTHNTLIEPGQMAITCADRPFHARSTANHGGASAMMHVLVPSQVMRSRIATVDRICAQAFLANTGAAKIAHGMFTGLLEEAPSMGSHEANELAISALDITVGKVNTEICDRTDLVADMNPQLARVIRFIDQHLSHQGLTAQDVAQGCNMSRRYLHYLMSGMDEKFGKYLWERRLVQAREWLSDREFNHFNVVDIAYMCGFKSGSHFSTLYKNRFGRSPTEERNATLGGIVLPQTRAN